MLSTVLVISGLMVKFNVTVLSQPFAAVQVVICCPVVLYVVPHTATLLPKHTVLSTVLVISGLMVKFNVTVLSQPFAAVQVVICCPVVLYVVPHTATLLPKHTVLSTVLVISGLMVKFNVTVLSHPFAAVQVVIC